MAAMTRSITLTQQNAHAARIAQRLTGQGRAHCPTLPAVNGVRPLPRLAVRASAEPTKKPSFQEKASQMMQTMDDKLENAMIAASVALMATPLPAWAEIVPTDDETVFADFNVSFLNQKVDHKFIVYAVVISQFIGTIGALVGGVSARLRKEEVERLNSRLVEVNRQLREMARSKKQGMYSPVEVSAITSEDEEDTSPEYSAQREEILTLLRLGKTCLKNKDGPGAKDAFERALVNVRANGQALTAPWKAERKALRGLGAAHLLMGEDDPALNYMFEVLHISKRENEMTGWGDAMGVIADIYTDMGDFEKAGVWYDKYIACMNAGDSYDEVSGEQLETMQELL